MKRAAVYGPWLDLAGEPLTRLILERDTCPAGDTRTAAWLMCNPSRAGHELDDPTCGRVVAHSARFGCDRSLIGNVWPLRTPYPAVLWATMGRGFDLPAEALLAMRAANLDALAMIGAQAELHVVAFGAEPARRHPKAVAAALEAFGAGRTLYCLGTTADNQPLHPLARGRNAIPRDVQLREWRP